MSINDKMKAHYAEWKKNNKGSASEYLQSEEAQSLIKDLQKDEYKVNNNHKTVSIILASIFGFITGWLFQSTLYLLLCC